MEEHTNCHPLPPIYAWCVHVCRRRRVCVSVRQAPRHADHAATTGEHAHNWRRMDSVDTGRMLRVVVCRVCPRMIARKDTTDNYYNG